MGNRISPRRFPPRTPRSAPPSPSDRPCGEGSAAVAPPTPGPEFRRRFSTALARPTLPPHESVPEPLETDSNASSSPANGLTASGLVRLHTAIGASLTPEAAESPFWRVSLVPAARRSLATSEAAV
jgi:hypothetical protein